MRKILVVGMSSLVATTFLVVTSNVALATCQTQTRQVGGRNQTAIAYGTRSKTWVNNFDANQDHTWRAGAVVLQNANNFAEAGWFLNATTDQKSHPYRSYKIDGVLTDVHYPAINLTQDAFEAFRVVDPNDDNTYQFYYGNNQMGGNQINVPLNASASLPVTSSESECAGDSLFAQFMELKRITSQNGSFVAYSQVIQYGTQNPGAYHYCPVAADAYDVRQTC